MFRILSSKFTDTYSPYTLLDVQTQRVHSLYGMSSDEFDNIPDDFADLQDVDWGQILAGPSNAANTQPAQIEAMHRVESPVTAPESNTTTSFSPSYFSDDDDMDSSFLAELDRVEQQVTHGTQVVSSRQLGGGVQLRATAQRARDAYGVGTSSSDQAHASLAPQHLSNRPSQVVTSRHFIGKKPVCLPQSHQRRGAEYGVEVSDSPSPQRLNGVGSAAKTNVEQPSNVPSKRPCPKESFYLISPKRKAKMKANDVQGFLSAYEDDLTCPICCDIFVFAHVGNPCGHTFCGECGWLWHVENKNKGCPCCRRLLEGAHPMIPNIAMDNVVDKHVQALAVDGAQEWEPGGRKYQEWAARKQAWKDSAARRERYNASRVVQKKPRSYAIQVFDPPLEWVDNVQEDPTYEEHSDVELIPRPIRRALRRRPRNPGGVNIIDLA